MKRAIYLATGLFAGLVLGGLVSYAFNTWYSGRYVHGDDDANVLVALTLFVFFPLGCLIGVASAQRMYRKRRPA